MKSRVARQLEQTTLPGSYHKTINSHPGCGVFDWNEIGRSRHGKNEKEDRRNGLRSW